MNPTNILISEDGNAALEMARRHLDRGEEAHAFGNGADDYLAKPFNMKELNERVRILLGVRE